jgi:hypothetical protein
MGDWKDWAMFCWIRSISTGQLIINVRGVHGQTEHNTLVANSLYGALYGRSSMARISGLEKKQSPCHLRWSYRALSSVPGAGAIGSQSTPCSSLSVYNPVATVAATGTFDLIISI